MPTYAGVQTVGSLDAAVEAATLDPAFAGMTGFAWVRRG